MINEIFSSKMNGLNVKLFEYDINDEKYFAELKEYLTNKIQNSKVHKELEYDLHYYGSSNLNSDFIKKFNEEVSRINIPKRAELPQFDVRRSRVTEWMAQIVLEKHYNCKFYDEADKRMNIDTLDIDKHISGIDVPGIMIDEDAMKFVICEVKASEENSIPCGSSDALRKDIQKSIDNDENRVSREILQYMHGIRNVQLAGEETGRILDFLVNLIAESSQSINFKKNLVFFPVLIRNNANIVKNKDVRDYKNFIISGIDSSSIENIICAFEASINDFSTAIYDEAIANE